MTILDDIDPPQVCNFRATPWMGRNADTKPNRVSSEPVSSAGTRAKCETGDYFLTAVSVSFFE